MTDISTQIFTGRFDKLDNEQFYIDLIIELSKRFQSELTIMSFENKTKAGLPTKDHYHFIMICPLIKEITHDKVRKYITKHNKELLGGSKSSLKNTEDKNKAFYYVLKQQKVVYTDLDEPTINEWLSFSKTYNEEIKINSWSEHLAEMIKQIQQQSRRDRPYLLMFIINYMISWNEKTDNEFRQIDRPKDLKHVVRQIEFKILSATDIYNIEMEEYGQFFYPISEKMDYSKLI